MTRKQIIQSIDAIIAKNKEITSDTHMDLVDELADFIEAQQNIEWTLGRKSLVDSTVYVAMYNPMIHESVYQTISLHETKRGAEMAIAFHRNEQLKEWNKIYNDNEEGFKFGTSESWAIGTETIQK